MQLGSPFEGGVQIKRESIAVKIWGTQTYSVLD